MDKKQVRDLIEKYTHNDGVSLETKVSDETNERINSLLSKDFSEVSDVSIFLNSERTPKADRVAAFNSGEIKIVDKTGFNSGDVIVEQGAEQKILGADGTVKDGVGEVFDIGMREAAEGLESVEIVKLDDDVNSPV